jgi:hypothetical protein
MLKYILIIIISFFSINLFSEDLIQYGTMSDITLCYIEKTNFVIEDNEKKTLEDGLMLVFIINKKNNIDKTPTLSAINDFYINDKSYLKSSLSSIGFIYKPNTIIYNYENFIKNNSSISNKINFESIKKDALFLKTSILGGKIPVNSTISIDVNFGFNNELEKFNFTINSNDIINKNYQFFTEKLKSEKEQFIEHIEQNIGKIDKIFNNVSNLYNLELFYIKNSEKYNCQIIITHGISNKEMNVPDDIKDYKFAEIILFLPKDWKIEENNFKIEQDDSGWPIYNIINTAEAIYKGNFFIYTGVSVLNMSQEKNVKNYGKKNNFIATIFRKPVLLGNETSKMTIYVDKRKNKNIYFYMPLFLYREEYNYRTVIDRKMFIEKLNKEIPDILDEKRKNICEKETEKIL